MKTVQEILDTIQPPLYRMYVGRFFTVQLELMLDQPPDDKGVLVLSFAELLPTLGVLNEEQYVSLLQLFVDNADKFGAEPILFVIVENSHVLLPNLLPINLKTMRPEAEMLPPWIRTETYNLTQLCRENKYRRWKVKSNESDAGSVAG